MSGTMATPDPAVLATLLAEARSKLVGLDPAMLHNTIAQLVQFYGMVLETERKQFQILEQEASVLRKKVLELEGQLAKKSATNHSSDERR